MSIDERIIEEATSRIRRTIADEGVIGDWPIGVFIHPDRPETATVYVSRSDVRFIPSGVVEVNS